MFHSLSTYVQYVISIVHKAIETALTHDILDEFAQVGAWSSIGVGLGSNN